MKALHLTADPSTLTPNAFRLATGTERNALLKLGPLVADMRGSIGGTVFARNRGGVYARARVVGINPQTARQVAVRASLGDLAQLWSTTLTDAQRAGWELYASNVLIPNALGEPRSLTGQQMYVRSNTLILDTGGTRVDDAPTVFTVGPTITPTYTNTPATDTISLVDFGGYDPATADEIGVLVQMGTPQNGGVQFFKSPFRKIGGAQHAIVPAAPVDMDAAYPFEAGQAIFIRTAVVTVDGRVGVPTTQRFLVE